MAGADKPPLAVKLEAGSMLRRLAHRSSVGPSAPRFPPRCSDHSSKQRAYK